MIAVLPTDTHLAETVRVTSERHNGRHDINDLEFMAIQHAVTRFGSDITVYSDSLVAINRARKVYYGLDIKHVRGVDNPADQFTKRSF